MTFRVGQKVVCVDDGPSKFSGHPANVKKDSVYTVSEAWIESRFGHPVVLLSEIGPTDGHDCFDANRFRPVVERKTDISIFTEILRTTKAPKIRETSVALSATEGQGK